MLVRKGSRHLLPGPNPAIGSGPTVALTGELFDWLPADGRPPHAALRLRDLCVKLCHSLSVSPQPTSYKAVSSIAVRIRAAGRCYRLGRITVETSSLGLPNMGRSSPRRGVLQPLHPDCLLELLLALIPSHTCWFRSSSRPQPTPPTNHGFSSDDTR
jgi:hypothetical protein